MKEEAKEEAKEETAQVSGMNLEEIKSIVLPFIDILRRDVESAIKLNLGALTYKCGIAELKPNPGGEWRQFAPDNTRTLELKLFLEKPKS